MMKPEFAAQGHAGPARQTASDPSSQHIPSATIAKPPTEGRQSRPCLPPILTAALRLPLLALLVVFLVTCEPAFAEDEFFGTNSPLLKFVDFMTGPFAYGVVIIALVVTVGALSVGGEFAGFARRMPIVVVAGAIVILASTVIKNLFGADRAADWPPVAGTDGLGVTMADGAAGLDPDAAVMPITDALMHDAATGHGGSYAIIVMGLVIMTAISCALLFYVNMTFSKQDRDWPAARRRSGRSEGSA